MWHAFCWKHLYLTWHYLNCLYLCVPPWYVHMHTHIYNGFSIPMTTWSNKSTKKSDICTSYTKNPILMLKTSLFHYQSIIFHLYQQTFLKLNWGWCKKYTRQMQRAARYVKKIPQTIRKSVLIIFYIKEQSELTNELDVSEHLAPCLGILLFLLGAENANFVKHYKYNHILSNTTILLQSS